MSEVQQKCELNDCNRAASTRCYCCNKSICTRHFIEHIDAIKAQVDPLADTINTVVENIRDFTIEQLSVTPLAQLNQWKNDMHKLIDEIFLTKSKEIEEIVEKNQEKFTEYKKQQLESIMKTQDDVKKLVEDGDVTLQQIILLKDQLANIEAKQTIFQDSFLSIKTQVIPQDSVTVSSTLNNPSIIPNIMCLPAPQTAFFGALTDQSSANPFSGSSTATMFTPFGFGMPTPENNPFGMTNAPTYARPAVRAKRR